MSAPSSSVPANAEASYHRVERQPIMKSLAPSTTGSLCTAFVVLGLVLGWCINDFWQRALNADLFDITTVREAPGGNIFTTFAYPLTLAFVEFAFTGVVFALVYAVIVQDRLGTASTLPLSFPPDRCWAMLVGSHVFGTFWLQSLMMPAQVMSLGLFAVSRAADVPMTTVMRSKVVGLPLGKRQLQTTCLTFVAACIMFYSYAQLSGCVCIWSGNGVALTGLAFWIVYFMILALPAANAVCQEAILVQREAHPLMILAVQNLFACLVFLPILMIAHMAGWEDVGEGLSMIFTHKPIFMVVLWLCVAMAATQAVCILLISMTNSFWAVALRALRVVIWGGEMLMLYSLGSPVPLSIACPHSSLWSLILTTGAFLAILAIYTDRQSKEEDSAPAAAKMPMPSLAVPAEDAKKAPAPP